MTVTSLQVGSIIIKFLQQQDGQLVDLELDLRNEPHQNHRHSDYILSSKLTLILYFDISVTERSKIK